MPRGYRLGEMMAGKEEKKEKKEEKVAKVEPIRPGEKRGGKKKSLLDTCE
jgi:hypothetical protein